MGLKDLMQKFTSGSDNDYDGYDPYYDDNDPAENMDELMGVPAQESTETYAQPADTYTHTARPQNNMNISGSAIELKVVKPESYKNASQIADHLLNGRTVVLNLENTNKETARRLIDFLTGAAYAIGGDIKKVSNNTYVITPGDSVAVSGDQLKSDTKPAPEAKEDSSEYFEL
ncbi:MAG: cell division protein SepF [Clostridia bacterium]|nr:cell division protein SepF [Clostridia bacterium]